MSKHHGIHRDLVGLSWLCAFTTQAANAEAQVTDTQAAEAQVTDTQVTDTQASDTQVTDTQASDTQASDTQASDTQASEAPSANWGPREERGLDPVVEGDPPSRADGGYGRFAGDLDVGLGLGAEIAQDSTRAATRLTLHYFSMAGVAVSYSDALGMDADVNRRLGLSVDMRPLFVPRWSNDLTQGPSFLDLTLDSFSIAAGVFWEEPRERSFGARRGFAGSLGLGIPLVARAQGPWLEGRATAQWASERGRSSSRAQGGAMVLLTWHHLFETPVVRRPE